MPGLSENEILRYSRHIVLREVGVKGQQRLKEASVLVIGAGGLGSPACLYLSAAGVGKIGVVDYDAVDLSNLQRQIIHSTSDVGRPKVESAKREMIALNDSIEVQTHYGKLSADNVMDLIRQYDIVIDGVDNFSARYLVNDACVMARKPLVEAGVLRFEGMVMVIKPGEGPCYRCVFPQPPAPGTVPTCREAGVMGAVAGVIGIIEAAEAIKLILGVGDPLVGKILTYDALSGTFQVIDWARKTNCEVCGDFPRITELKEYDLACTTSPYSVGHGQGDTGAGPWL